MDHGIVTVSKFEILTYRFVSMDYTVTWWRLISRISAQDGRVGNIAIVLKLNSKDTSSCAEMSQDKSNHSWKSTLPIHDVEI